MPAPRPLPADPLVALADQCVQCGLCLPACPTYRHDGLEPESPRGRIALARAWALDTIPSTAAGDAHLDHCLGCRSCEAACPAGVRFGALLVEARARQRERRPPGRVRRMVEWLAARPARLRRLLGLYRRVARWAPARWRPFPLPPAPHPDDPLRSSARRNPDPRQRGAERVALFVGCAAAAYEPATRVALVRLLAAAGIESTVPAAQTCCGSLHAHGGDTATAARLATVNAAAFTGQSTVLTLASGCHEAVAASVGPGTRAVDALELLADRVGSLALRASNETVALHLPCTQRNVVGSVPAMRRLLDAVPATRVVPLDAGHGCCGAAGTQWIDAPARAASYRAPLLAQLHASGAQRLLSANIGCRLHLQGGTTFPVEHPIEFLARHLESTAGPHARG